MKERWIYWKTMTQEQVIASATINELEKLQKSFDVNQFLLNLFLFNC